ncbi:hypothetical protein [Salegentibacter maritimus]|uniref:hypothetical protein n=1 Tax=Salegentibacter maritimus TaxID=2794347 RepID=UPI0018E436CE|nr:hypothetical protein [Salegentibacter maritimus]MBI6115981.1 hypothetical protein [Salegentibacter maritimus]
MSGPDPLSHFTYLEIQKRIVRGFQELKTVTEELASRTRQLGWKQRNVLIDHVYSDYQKHHQLAFARREWEETSREYNMHKGLYELMREYRDIYGYFPEYMELYDQIDRILDLAGRQDEFEIARFILNWKQKLFFKDQFQD